MDWTPIDPPGTPKQRRIRIVTDALGQPYFLFDDGNNGAFIVKPKDFGSYEGVFGKGGWQVQDELIVAEITTACRQFEARRREIGRQSMGDAFERLLVQTNA